MPRFSPNTIIEVVDALNLETHADIDKFVLRFEIKKADCPNPNATKSQRKMSIISYLVDHPDEKGPFGANLIFEIIEHVLGERLSLDTWSSESQPEYVFPKLVHSLKHDGYVIENAKLKIIFPESVQIAETENELDSLKLRHKHYVKF
jgi:hypothetical protein